MDLLSTLRQQMQLGLTGKINLLARESGQFLGCLYLVQGHLAGGRYRGLRGKDAVILVCYHGMPGQKKIWGEIRLVCEPEVIPASYQGVKWDFNQLQVELHRYILEWEKVRPLLPPSHLFLLPRMPSAEIDLSPEQFQILTLLSENPKVDEFTQNCPYLPTKGLEVLISLRKMGLIRVAATV